jgi:predicted component of type VI protein secretion system
MTVNLIVLSEVHQGRRIPVAVPEFLIGRDPNCHLRAASSDVGRLHCAIVTKRGRVFLRDESRTEGTLLNRRLLLGGEVQLVDGDHIAIGPLLFLVTFEPDGPVGARNRAAVNAAARHDAGSHTPHRQLTFDAARRPKTPSDAEEALYF